MRVVLAVLCLLSLTTAAHAVPTCVPGTMADYLALSDGCRLGAITVSDFSYSGSTESIEIPGVFDVPPSQVSIITSLPFGASSLRLGFQGGWTDVHISYTAEAGAPWIRQFNLLFFGGGPSASGIAGGGTPGANDLSTLIDAVGFPTTVRQFDTRSFDPISLTTISLSGGSPAHPFGDVGSFGFDVVTPEPTTLLIWATGAAGIGLARWRRRRQYRDHAA